MHSYITVILLGFVFWGTIACSSPDIDNPDPNVCTTANCPSGFCNLRLSLHTDCSGMVDMAEVLLEQALEPLPLTYGSTFVSEGDIPVGPGHQYWVRSEEIQWGPLTYKCSGPGSGSIVTLSCCPEDNKELCK